MVGTGVSSDEREAHARQAMALLRQAARMGYRNPQSYGTETAIDPLLGRKHFLLLMLDLAFPKDVFSHGH